MCLFIVLTFLSLPNGVPLVGFWSLAVIAVWRPRPWSQISLTGAVVLGCLLISGILPDLLATLSLAPSGREYGLITLVDRFSHLQWSDWHRLAFLVLPCGILPAAALLAWSWQDKLARTLTLVTLGYFCFFYFQAYIALHHFVPAMLLPLVVFWRSDKLTDPRHKPLLLAGVAIAGIASLVLSLPENAAPDTSARRIGSMVDDRVGGYEAFDHSAFRRAEVLLHLFPHGWERLVPEQRYGGSPLAWNYYAHRVPVEVKNVNYVLQHPGVGAPPGMRFVARQDDVALYIRSDSIWKDQVTMQPPTPAGSRLYTIPPWMLFRRPPPPGGTRVIQLWGRCSNGATG
jgi:hypothetical protein